jgi:enoyl-CoA hydratase/carnithine racemase
LDPVRYLASLELPLSTDIRAAVPEARFGLPEVKWAIYPFGGRGTAPIPVENRGALRVW